ncbi:VOC family protein [Sinirhodobacter populi]|uniref:VOC family protein n=1 Tax=Paenirhodobacter populi TaxID=2306993 RepID=A0A443K3T1_9RHOB|nr:VOC family protein [Sinirhodobacter populi]RWR27363.1 VOC family protein [Sinirhodobacter populi]
MTHPINGIDHAYLLVHDLDASAEQFRRLGFTLSPRGLHSPEKGTGNHTIVFRDDYLELLGIVAPTPLNDAQRQLLASEGEGLRAIANRPAEGADAARQPLAERGFTTSDVSAFSRPVPLPGGGETPASFRTLSLAPGSAPLGHFFLCEHLTPEAVWRDELRTHANGARALSAVVGVAEDPQAAAQAYARLYAGGKVTAIGDGYRIETGIAGGKPSAAVEILSPVEATVLYGDRIGQTPRTGYAALRLLVDDLAQTAEALRTGDVSFDETPRGLQVSPGQAAGVILEFVSA